MTSKTIWTTGIGFLCALLIVSAGEKATAHQAAEDRGAKTHTLYGGKPGNVPFNHHLHQDSIDDCMACHQFFPKKTGAIDALKKEKKLKKMQVMNKTCIKCHKLRKNEKRSTGPIGCKECHIK